MERVLLTLGGVQLEAVWDESRSLFVLFEGEVSRPAGPGSLAAFLPRPLSSPSRSPARYRSSSPASSDHEAWRPRLRTPCPVPGPARSRSPPLAQGPNQRLPPRPPAVRRPRSERPQPETGRAAHGVERRPEPPSATPRPTGPARRRRRRGNRAGQKERDRRVARATGTNATRPANPFGTPPAMGPAPSTAAGLPLPAPVRRPRLHKPSSALTAPPGLRSPARLSSCSQSLSASRPG